MPTAISGCSRTRSSSLRHLGAPGGAEVRGHRLASSARCSTAAPCWRLAVATALLPRSLIALTTASSSVAQRRDVGLERRHVVVLGGAWRLGAVGHSFALRRMGLPLPHFRAVAAQPAEECGHLWHPAGATIQASRVPEHHWRCSEKKCPEGSPLPGIQSAALTGRSDHGARAKLQLDTRGRSLNCPAAPTRHARRGSGLGAYLGAEERNRHCRSFKARSVPRSARLRRSVGHRIGYLPACRRELNFWAVWVA